MMRCRAVRGGPARRRARRRPAARGFRCSRCAEDGAVLQHAVRRRVRAEATAPSTGGPPPTTMTSYCPRHHGGAPPPRLRAGRPGRRGPGRIQAGRGETRVASAVVAVRSAAGVRRCGRDRTCRTPPRSSRFSGRPEGRAESRPSTSTRNRPGWWSGTQSRVARPRRHRRRRGDPPGGGVGPPRPHGRRRGGRRAHWSMNWESGVQPPAFANRRPRIQRGRRRARRRHPRASPMREGRKGKPERRFMRARPAAATASSVRSTLTTTSPRAPSGCRRSTRTRC
jgi:hypothetical protein